MARLSPRLCYLMQGLQTYGLRSQAGAVNAGAVEGGPWPEDPSSL